MMLDHRKKRVKRVAKVGFRELVPMLRDILERPRWFFRLWRTLALRGNNVRGPVSLGTCANFFTPCWFIPHMTPSCSCMHV
ncbi:unnamed protein product [Durusdinium trenchii]|uniref:Uncharacterized protein n=1 Tax=Durusdinium trenchii TaxID=1381693 RepID=A0ABP0LCF4_9DINO